MTEPPAGSHWTEPLRPEGKQVGTMVEHHDSGVVLVWASVERYGPEQAREKVERALRSLGDWGHDLAEGAIRTEHPWVVARTVCLSHAPRLTTQHPGHKVVTPENDHTERTEPC